MFDTLIESKRKTNRKKGFSVGFVSLSIHAAIIAAAVAATLHAGQADHAVKVDTAMVYLEQHHRAEAARAAAGAVRCPAERLSDGRGA